MGKKKIEREYLVTDDSVNVYGFRLLTSGYLQDRFAANPIGFRMHERKDGVVLRWEDFRRDGDKVYAKPVINLSNPLGQQTASEVENGFLNAASMGKIVVLEFSDDADKMLPGQTGPTITKWYNKELSLVDIPGNENALAPQLLDANDNEINLTDFIERSLAKQPVASFPNLLLNKQKMEFKNQLLGALNLADNSSDEAVFNYIKDLSQKAARATDLEARNTELQTQLSDIGKKADAEKVEAILGKALTDKKITNELKATLAADYEGNPEGLQNLVGQLKAYVPVSQKLEAEKSKAEDLAAKSWDELDREGKLADLKDADLDGFKAKFRERFGKDYV